MTVKKLPARWESLYTDVYGRHDHFTEYLSGGRFTTVASDAGTATVSDGVNGILTIAASDGTQANNDETYVKGTTEIYKFAANAPFSFSTEVMIDATDTDTANYIAGVKDAVAANTLLDDGGGPAASYSGAVFFKADGATTWSVESSIGTTQTTVDTGVTASSTAYQTLEIEFYPITSTTGEVHFMIDGQEVGLNDGDCHIVTFASATEMQECFGVKDGADTNAAQLLVDRSDCDQLRV